MRILLSEAEQALLDQCRPETERVYRHLRQRMDTRTALVGNLPANRLSYGRLGIEVQYAPPQGSTAVPWKPGNRELQCRIDELVRVGLVERAVLIDARGAPSSSRQLVLRCLAVHRDSCVQNHERAMNVRPERESERYSETQVGQGLAGEWTLDEREAVTGHEREIFSDSVIRDDDTRERGGADQGWNGNAGGDASKAPAAQSATDGNTPERAAVQALKAALGADLRFDQAFARAAADLGEVVRQRLANGETPVSDSEVQMAVGVARQRGIARQALPSYAVKVVLSGGLLPREPRAKVVPLRPVAGVGAGALDEMEAFIRECEGGGNVIDGCA